MNVFHLYAEQQQRMAERVAAITEKLDTADAKMGKMGMLGGIYPQAQGGLGDAVEEGPQGGRGDGALSKSSQVRFIKYCLAVVFQCCVSIFLFFVPVVLISFDVLV